MDIRSRTLRDYFASLPNGPSDQVVGTDLRNTATANFEQASEWAQVARTGDYNDLNNLPALGGAAFLEPYVFASAEQGLLASTALQPEAIIPWADISGKPEFFSGAYDDLTGKPALFSGAYEDLTGKPTLFSGAYADLTGKPDLFSGDYGDLSGKPILGALSSKDVIAVEDITASGTPSSTTYLRGDGVWATPAGGGGGAGTVNTIIPGSGISVDSTDAANPIVSVDFTVGSLASKNTVNNADWSGADLEITNGGTGASSASEARDNLGLTIGTNVQAYSAKLAAYAAQTWDADTITYQTGTGTLGTTALTSFGRSLIDDADAAAARTTLGLVIGTNVQAYNAKLGTLAGQTWAADRFTYYTSASAAAVGTITSFGRSLIDDADAATARTTLGLGTAATTASTAYASAAQGGLADGAAQKSANLSDLANVTTARSNLGLGGAATLSVGTAAGTVAAGDDSRFAAIAQKTDENDAFFFAMTS